MTARPLHRTRITLTVAGWLIAATATSAAGPPTPALSLPEPPPLPPAAPPPAGPPLSGLQEGLGMFDPGVPSISPFGPPAPSFPSIQPFGLETGSLDLATGLRREAETRALELLGPVPVQGQYGGGSRLRDAPRREDQLRDLADYLRSQQPQAVDPWSPPAYDDAPPPAIPPTEPISPPSTR